MRLPVIFLVGGLTLGAWGASPPEAGGAEEPAVRPADFRITDLKRSTHAPPDFGVSTAALGNKGEWAKKRWLIIDVTFQTEPEWVDAVDLKFYVVIGAGRHQQMLTGELTLLNIKKGRHHHAAMFLHPSTLERFGGREPEAVAVRLVHRGQPMAEFSDRTEPPRWWERFSPVTGYLLKPAETPWAVLAHQRYEAIKASE